MLSFLSNIQNKFSNDIGIDLGTANTLVYVRGLGIVINEPSIVAVNVKTDRIIALGQEAKQMMGRTPQHIKCVRPLVDGVISDYEVTEEMLGYLIGKANEIHKKLLGPRVVVGVPVGITNVETRAVYDAARAAGAREVYIIEEPLAAAIGIKLPVHEAEGSMIVDIGGGTTDIAVISLSGIVRAKSVKIAGDKLITDIISYIKDEYKLHIGEKTAEEIKILIGSAMPVDDDDTSINVKGRDMVSGLPKEVIVSDNDIRKAMYNSIAIIVEAIKEVIELTPPEILTDIMKKGIVLSGGGALIRGLDELLRIQLKVPITICDEPLTAVAKGCGVILEDIKKYKNLLIEDHNEIAIR
jgi:rod shape-determining protein MreB and related proteins